MKNKRNVKHCEYPSVGPFAQKERLWTEDKHHVRLHEEFNGSQDCNESRDEASADSEVDTLHGLEASVDVCRIVVDEDARNYTRVGIVCGVDAGIGARQKSSIVGNGLARLLRAFDSDLLDEGGELVALSEVIGVVPVDRSVSPFGGAF